MRADHVKEAEHGIDYAYQVVDKGHTTHFYYYLVGAVVHALLAIAQAIRDHD